MKIIETWHQYCALRKTQDEAYFDVVMATILAPNISFCSEREKEGPVHNTHNAQFVLSFLITFVKPKKGECHSCKKDAWKLNCYHGNITICITVCPQYFQRDS